MIKKCAAILLTLAVASYAWADGCLPGEPCYYGGSKQAPVADTAVTPVASSDYQTFYATLGAGWNFLEKDQEILGHAIYEARVGAYRFAENLTAEIGVGIMPDIRNREHTGGGFALSDDTSGVRLVADLLYHLDSNGDGKQFDPYVAIGAGALLYDDELKNGKEDWFVGAGAGAFVNLNDDFFLKPDYRLNSVGSNTELNHTVTLALGYRFCL